MTARTEVEAVQLFQDIAQRTASCISNGIVSINGGYYASATPHRMTFGPETHERLGGPGRLFFSFTNYYRIIRINETNSPWRVVISAYVYTLYDVTQREIVSYHWHPTQRGHVKHPHLHLEAGAQVGREDIANAHLTTGFVTLSDIVRMAITELNVTPRRDDWEAILDEAQEVASHFEI